MMDYRTNYTNGYIVQYSKPCFKSWLLVPGENLWSEGVRGFLYVLAILYTFLGIAIVADIFISCIEVITSKKRKVTRYDPEKQESIEIEVFVWNETVANLTLMALGSSAPEILLAVIETCQQLGAEEDLGDGLGTFTIVGSASFNLLLITAICVISVPTGSVKRVREFGVFIVTAVWSLFAYVWLLVTLKWNTPEVVDLWEAIVTLAFFPLLVLTSWCQDNGWWCKRSKILNVDPPQVRVVGIADTTSSHVMIHRSMELGALEQHRVSVSDQDLKDLGKSKGKIRDVVALWRDQKPDQNSNQTAESVALALQKLKQTSSQPQNTATTRLRFRHAALRSVTRSKRMTKITEADNSENEQAMNVLAKSFVGSRFVGTGSPDDSANRRFCFGTSSYSVLKSAMHLDIEILLTNKRRRSSQVGSPKPNLTLPAPYDPSTPINALKWSKLTIPAISTEVIVSESNGSPANTLTPVNKRVTAKENMYTREDSPTDTNSENSVNMDEDNSHRRDSMSSPHSTAMCVDYETRDGNAKHGKDYQSVRGTMAFKAGINKHVLRIPITQHDDYAKNKDFYVMLKNPAPQGNVDLGEPNLTRVTIIDDDEPGEFSFEQASYHANFLTGDVVCTVVRRKGCDGTVNIRYHTMNGTATGGSEDELEDLQCDYVHVNDGSLVFQQGEMSKQIIVRINPETQNTNFIVLIHDPSPGACIGERTATVVHISSDVDDIVDRVANIITAQDEESLSKSWRSQFEDAMVIQGDEDENGKELPLTTTDFILHFLTFFWKVLFAFIPPRPYMGGWPAFCASLIVIAGLTAIVEQIGKLLGCVVGLKNSVTGITIIAIGTSLPDTFASRSAALHDKGADAAIGNITGSNSVNVFLGLGLPWVISACYHAIKGTKYRVSSDNLAFSVLVFTSFGGVCLIILVLRRVFLKGELGGPSAAKWLTGFVLLILWFVYIILSSLMAYEYIPNTI